MIRTFEEHQRYLSQLGLGNVQHIHDDLLAHLVGTYQCLLDWDMPESVSLAGLFHSVYGTEGFPLSSISIDRREELIDQIGEEAEQLVYRYCAMTYQSLQKSVDEGQPCLRNRFTDEAMNVSKEDFERLLWIKLADAVEQSDENTAKSRFFRRVADLLGSNGVNRWNSQFPH